jgi:hypothetical protein
MSNEIPQEAVTSVAIQTGTTARTVRAVVSAALPSLRKQFEEELLANWPEKT